MAKHYETFFCDVNINWESNLRLFIAGYILVMNMFEIVVFHGVDLYLHRDDMLSVTELIFFLFINLLAVVKTSTFVFQEEKHRALSDTMDKLHESQTDSDEYVQSITRVAKLIAKGWYTMVFMGFVIMVALMLIQTPISISKRELLFRGYYPYDVTASPYFEMTVLFRTTMATFNVGSFILCDTSLIITLVNTIAQFKILRHNIKHVRDHAVQNVKRAQSASQPRGLHARGSLVDVERGGGIPADARVMVTAMPRSAAGMNVNRWQRSPTPECDDVREVRVEPWRPHSERELFDVEAQVERGRVRGQQQHEGLTNGGALFQLHANDSEETHYWEELLKVMKHSVEREMENELRKCVRHHQELLCFVGDLEAAFNPYFIVQLLSNLIPTGAIATYATLTTQMDIKIVLLLVLLFGCFSELFILCTLSNEITKESDDVKHAVYECDWLDASEGFKRSMRIISSRSNDPVVMQAAWYVPLSMETFSNVSNTAYSYFMVFQTLAHKK